MGPWTPLKDHKDPKGPKRRPNPRITINPSNSLFLDAARSRFFPYMWIADSKKPALILFQSTGVEGKKDRLLTLASRRVQFLGLGRTALSLTFLE